ncbi:MAG: hypothetical protein MJZ98_07610 [Paludibacteraceae bacterium]|nr:hypothetical protein [Paludibacteraceae bacterium]
MEKFTQYLGVLIELVGVVILFCYSRIEHPSNTLLIVAMVCVLLGVIAQVLLNKINK